MELVMSPWEVRETELEPAMEPARLSAPAAAVNSTVAAEIVPADELVMLFAAVRSKSVPAEERLDKFAELLSLMLTSPAALALRFAIPVVRAAPDSPTLPAVDVRFNVGVVTVA